tara:strand:+ start:183 stop:704 length:522 start_codon:yes stop_codon:yes gene_type:complete
MITAILACDEKWGIGKAGTLPWPKNTADLKWFKEETFGHVVIMGRNTWNAPGMPNPLAGRINVVITRDTSVTLAVPGILSPYLTTLDELPNILEEWQVVPGGFPLLKVFVIGGANLVESMLDQIDEIWLSCIDGDWDCDTFLPKEKIKSMFERDQHLDYRADGLIIETWTKRK